MGVCNCSMFCCTLLYVHFSIAIILMGKRELIDLLNLSSWCLVMVERLFPTVPQGCLQFVILVFPDHTHLLFFIANCSSCTAIVNLISNCCQIHVIKYCEKVYKISSKNLFWYILNIQEKHYINLKLDGLCTYDFFSTLYTTLLHNLIRK